MNLNLVNLFIRNPNKQYDLLLQDKNRNGGGVACCIRSDISYIKKQYFPEEMENIFFGILLPKTKPIVIGIIYRSSSQNKFLEILNKKIYFYRCKTNIHPW